MDVSSFCCGGCTGKSNDSASQDCRAGYMLRMRNAAGQREHAQKLFMWWKYFSGSGQHHLDQTILLNIRFVSVICPVLVFPLFHPLPQSISEKSQDFTELQENIPEVRSETRHSCPPAPILTQTRALPAPFSAAELRSCSASQRHHLVLKSDLSASAPGNRPAPTPLCANTSIQLVPQ